mgnify:CR=1 FL=1
MDYYILALAGSSLLVLLVLLYLIKLINKLKSEIQFLEVEIIKLRGEIEGLKDLLQEEQEEEDED